MKKGNGNLPAFPPALDGVGGGLTKREWFAAIALQGLVSNEHSLFKSDVQNAVMVADLLLAELEKDNAE